MDDAIPEKHTEKVDWEAEGNEGDQITNSAGTDLTKFQTGFDLLRAVQCDFGAAPREVRGFEREDKSGRVTLPDFLFGTPRMFDSLEV